jgi:hypothetical protein
MPPSLLPILCAYHGASKFLQNVNNYILLSIISARIMLLQIIHTGLSHAQN